jgi:hypothetical protein
MTKNHTGFYLDKLIRTQKANSILAIINASYHIDRENSSDFKADIEQRLVHAYALFRDNIRGHNDGVGSYTGDDSQFQSQYTLALEFGIWKNNKSYILSELAEQVAKNDITIKDYLTIVFLNYFQPINSISYNPLLIVLEGMYEKGISELNKEIFSEIIRNQIESDTQNINGFWDLLKGTRFFKYDYTTSKLKYIYKLSLDNLIDKIDKTYLGEEGYQKALDDFEDNELKFDKYLHKNILDNKLNSSMDKSKIKGGYNKIYYGIPGSGKSYRIKHEVLKDVDPENILRITFYLDYSNSEFIGQILPRVEKDIVSYDFVPGPFTKAIKKAFENPDKMIYLVIEEINRGNAAAIFGSVFQLLDRVKQDDVTDVLLFGESEYPVSNSFIEDYFKTEGIPILDNKLKIPSNMTILSSMNTSDQNVFPLDTAFKRRWLMERVNYNWDECSYRDWIIPNKSTFDNFTWKQFVEFINNRIIEFGQDGMNLEDKQLGAFFVDKCCLINPNETSDDIELKLENFCNKVLEYIWNDVSKYNRSEWFVDNPKSLNQLIDKFESVYMMVFTGDELVGLENQ